MRKTVKIIAIFFALVFLCGAVIHLSAGVNKSLQEESGMNRISYRAIMQDTLTEETYTSKIDERFFKEDGLYPTYYETGKIYVISDLKEIIYTSDTVDWEFHGWYLDKDLTEKFNGTISKDSDENITLYASIWIIHWTKLY